MSMNQLVIVYKYILPALVIFSALKKQFVIFETVFHFVKGSTRDMETSLLVSMEFFTFLGHAL